MHEEPLGRAPNDQNDNPVCGDEVRGRAGRTINARRRSPCYDDPSASGGFAIAPLQRGVKPVRQLLEAEWLLKDGGVM